MLKESDKNNNIAATCLESNAACCRKGKLFIPVSEYHQMLGWITEHNLSELDEFNSRLEAHEGFYLYDQQEKCQFLDENALCRLHESQVKPSECFWWPLHVYVNPDENLEIKSAAYCCLAALEISKDDNHVRLIEQQAKAIGFDVIRKFREAYPGLAQSTALVKELTEMPS